MVQVPRHPAGRRLGALAIAAAFVAVACSAGSTPAPSVDDSVLANGVRLDLQGRCEPHREDLPDATLVAIQCSTADERSGVRFYLFNRQEELMAAYLGLLEDAGIEPRMQEGSGGRNEGAYVPGDEPGGPLTATRQASYVDEVGHAHFLATMPPFVLTSAESLDGDADWLSQWSWLGNQDVPGAPTLWREVPVNPDEGKG